MEGGGGIVTSECAAREPGQLRYDSCSAGLCSLPPFKSLTPTGWQWRGPSAEPAWEVSAQLAPPLRASHQPPTLRSPSRP